MNNLKNKKWLWLAVIALFIFSAMQFIRPKINNPPVTADIKVPGDVKQFLRSACYDCNSNETKLSSFDKITPGNFLVAGHIKDGREVLNFSEWADLQKTSKKKILFESFNQIEFGVMPLKQYTRLHPSAKNNARQINSLTSFLNTLMVLQHPDSSKTNRWNTQIFL